MVSNHGIRPRPLPGDGRGNEDQTPRARYMAAMGAALALSLEAAAVAQGAIDIASSDWDGSVDTRTSMAEDVARTGGRLARAAIQAVVVS